MKKDPTAWLSAARRELEDLLTTGGVALTDADAWRALALTARLAFGLDGASARSASDRALVEVRLGACAEPNPGELCDALDDALVGDDPPEASLLDCLLDIDDLAGVLCLRGAEGAATELIDDACATLSVQPERLAPLADFARMRLATLGPSTPVGVLWARVEGALIEAAVATQPIATAPSVEAIAVRERIARASSAVVELATRRRLLLPARPRCARGGQQRPRGARPRRDRRRDRRVDRRGGWNGADRAHVARRFQGGARFDVGCEHQRDGPGSGVDPDAARR